MTLTLRPLPPFRLDYTVWALRRRERNQIDRWDGVTYRRVVFLEGRATELAIRQPHSKGGATVLEVATPQCASACWTFMESAVGRTFCSGALAGWTHSLGDDVGARNRLAKWLGRSAQLDYNAVAGIVGRW